MSFNCASTSIGAANQLFLTLIQSLAMNQCSLSPKIQWPKDRGEQIQVKGILEFI